MNDSDTKTIQKRLDNLIGLKLTGCGRAADMRMIQFGAMIDSDQDSEGQFALHIQCPWRIENCDEIVTGRADLWEPIDRPEGFSYDDWDYQRDGNLQDKLVNEMMDRSNKMFVEFIEVHTHGSFTIGFSDQYQLLVFPAGSDGEDWRLFQPGLTEEDDIHFVISGGEID